MQFCGICTSMCVNNKCIYDFCVETLWSVVGPSDLLSSRIDQVCSYLFSNMGCHNFHLYLHISLHLNRIILHGSSSGVAGLVNHNSQLLILRLSTS